MKELVIPPEVNLSEIPGAQVAVRIGHNLHLELPYKGKPKPSISWLKDGLPLKEVNTFVWVKLKTNLL